MFVGIRDIAKWSPRMRAPLEATYGLDYFKTTWEGWVDAFIAIYKENGGDLCNNDLGKIRCPTFILHGAKDPMVGPEHPRNLHENISNSR